MERTCHYTLLRALREAASVTSLKHHESAPLRLLHGVTSLYGPIRPSGPSHTLFVAVESPRLTPALNRFAQALRTREIRDVARGRVRHASERVVPVPNVSALCAGRSMAHIAGGSTEHARLRENGTALCRAAIAEAEACVAAAMRARVETSRASCAEHARVALEAARHVAEEFELGAAVVVPAFSVLAPDLWDLVAPAYAREAAMLGGSVQLPDDDADAMEALVW